MDLGVLGALLLAVCGVGVGVLSAMFGIGGGMIMVPLLHVGFGLPAAFSSATSLFAILPTSVSGAYARRSDGTIHWRTGLTIGAFGMLTAPLGALAATHLPGIYAMVLMGCFVLFTAYKQFRKVWQTRPGAPATAKAGSGKAGPGENSARSLAIGGCIGLIVGFLSGFVGLGGGFIVVPVLQGIYRFSTKEATGTSLVSVALLSIPSFVTHALLGNVQWLAGLMLIAGSLVGTRLGAAIIRHVNERLLTFLFGMMLIIAGVLTIVREFL